MITMTYPTIRSYSVLFVLFLFMMTMMMMMTVRGHTTTEANGEASYHHDSTHAKVVTLYHSIDGLNHDDHASHYSYSPPNHHHHNDIPRFWKDINDDIPMRIKKTGSDTMTTTKRYSPGPPFFDHHLSLSLPKAVKTLDIFQNNIPCDDDHGDNVKDNIHCDATMTKATTNRTLLASSSSIGCIYNETEMRLAISNTPNSSLTTIETCSSYILINASQPNPSVFNLQGILINQKILVIYCNINDTTTNNCIMDAKSLSRIFIIIASQVSFQNIVL
jgi:hypothetical protein